MLPVNKILIHFSGDATVLQYKIDEAEALSIESDFTGFIEKGEPKAKTYNAIDDGPSHSGRDVRFTLRYETVSLIELTS